MRTANLIQIANRIKILRVSASIVLGTTFDEDDEN